MPKGSSSAVFETGSPSGTVCSDNWPLLEGSDGEFERVLSGSLDKRKSSQEQSADVTNFVMTRVLTLLLIAVTTVTIVMLATSKRTEGGISRNSVSSSAQCYRPPSCENVNAFYDVSTGFTNDTGWESGLSYSCCQICLPDTSPTVCFNNDPDCLSKTGYQDYDYLMLDQMWIPQFCSALSQGHDFTVSHLTGSSCPSVLDDIPKLSIHGLWPNYNSGFPQCCHQENGMAIEAISPDAVAKWPIYSDLAKNWLDLTASSYSCSVCYLLNHEWEKHGTCFTSDPETYFTAGLSLHNSLASANQAVQSLRGPQSPVVVPLSDLTSLYSSAVNIICDPKDSLGNSTVGVLSEIQTCWQTPKDSFSPVQVDCHPATPQTFTTPCPDFVLMR